MKAIVVHDTPAAPRLVWEEVAAVSPGAGEVLVSIEASAVNRADLSQARGNYPAPAGASEILGLEMAGVIVALGAAVAGWQPGDRVCALLPGGGYAEQVVVPADMLMRLPDDWSWAMGAAIPEVWFTAYVNLFLEGSLVEGERVLIHAGGSGVGTAAVQLARVSGAEAYVTAGTPEKLARCRALGATLAVNYKETNFLEAVMGASDGAGVNLILDPVGADNLARNLAALAPLGRLVHIGTLSGGQTEINLGLVLGKRLRLIGSTLRRRPLAEKIAITRGFSERFWPLLRAGTLVPVIDRTFPLPRAQEAHAYVAENRNIGKVILLRETNPAAG